MKIIFTLFLFLFSQIAFAQEDSLTINISLEELFSTSDIYVYNDEKDTIYLSELNVGRFGFREPLKKVMEIQIDGIGAKEVVFRRKGTGQTEDHGGTFDISEDTEIIQYEVWNLDTKEMLFYTISFYIFNYKNFNAHANPSHQKGTCFLSQRFKIDDDGKITIKDKVAGVNNEKPACHAFKKEGTYLFIDGKYELEE